MRFQVMGRLRALLLLPLLVWGRPGVAQDGEDWTARALGSVIDYRVSVLADTTAKFDGCRLSRHLGERAIAEPVRHWVTPCEAEADSPGNRNVVLVDSVTHVPDGDIIVYATVIRGEWVHRENYALIPRATGGPFIGVREVRLWGAVQVYPRRPVRTGASN